MGGYSGKPLRQKLGIKDRMKLQIVSPPDGYFDWIEMPETKPGKAGKESVDFIHAFFSEQSALIKSILPLKTALKKEGMLWISWPKKSRGIATDVDEHIVRNVGLEVGLVDVKICAVSETWSALKFVYRMKDR